MINSRNLAGAKRSCTNGGGDVTCCNFTFWRWLANIRVNTIRTSSLQFFVIWLQKPVIDVMAVSAKVSSCSQICALFHVQVQYALVNAPSCTTCTVCERIPAYSFFFLLRIWVMDFSSVTCQKNFSYGYLWLIYERQDKRHHTMPRVRRPCSTATGRPKRSTVPIFHGAL